MGSSPNVIYGLCAGFIPQNATGNYEGISAMNATDTIDPSWTPASDAEVRFAQLWVTLYPALDLYTEYQFSKRRYRFDFCCPVSRVAIEIQGGTWGKSGHSTGAGIARDYKKINLAQQLGWQVFQLTPDASEDGAELARIAECIEQRKTRRGTA